VAIGARDNDANGDKAGHVRVYQYSGTVWIQLGQDIDGEAEDDWSGETISLSSDGTIVAIGARYNQGINGFESGHVRVYQYDGSVWVQLGLDIDGEAADDWLGYGSTSVSLSSDGTILATGARYNDGINDEDEGHVRVFGLSPNLA